MRILLLSLLLLSLAFPLRSDPSAAPAPTPAKTDDLSGYKTADDLWAHIQALKSSLGQAMQNGEPAAKTMIPQMRSALTGFAAKYPQDHRSWGAKLLLCQLDQIAGKMRLPGAPSKDEITKRLDAIATDKTAPNDARAQASFEVILLSFPQKLDDPFDPDALDAKIAAFQKDYGDFSPGGGQPAIFMLREQEIEILKLTGHNTQLVALLTSLSTDSHPELVQMAQLELAQQKKIAELKAKPCDLKYTAVDGSEVDFAKLRGKVVLLDFWATWCGPCVAEMPEVVEAYQKYHAQGFEIVGVSLDQDKATMLDFTKQSGMPWPQFFDGQGFDNAVAKSFGINSIPTMWLFDKKGMLANTSPSGALGVQVEQLLKAK